MEIIGWYYLHTNGELIYKRNFDGTEADIRESSFSRALWPVDPSDRAGGWTILVEALAAGANEQFVMDRAEQWNCDDEDARIYAERVGCILSRDGNAWCATRKDFVDLAQSPAGFGDTCLKAMAELAKTLGYRPSKMGRGFADYLK